MGNGPSQNLDAVELTRLPPSLKTLTWPTETLVSYYGILKVTMSADTGSLTFSIQGTGNEVYNVYYYYNSDTIDSNNGNKISTSLNTAIDFDGVKFANVKVVQPKEFTPSQVASFTWLFKIQLSEIPENLAIIETHVDVTGGTQTLDPIVIDSVPVGGLTVPRIQVQFVPLDDFEDLASTIFTIEDGKTHSCVKSCYKQLIGQEGKEIHVLTPFIGCYLAGTGEFSVEKMASVNGSNEPVWPQVSLYAMVKFILNRLMNHKFSMKVVLRKNTPHFLKQLKSSEYSNFLEYFEQNKDLEKYFL